MITKDVNAMVTYSFSYADEIGWKKNGIYPQDAEISLRAQLKNDLLVFLGYIYDENSSDIYEQIDFINDTLKIVISKENFIRFMNDNCAEEKVLAEPPLSLVYFVRDDISPYSRRAGYGMSLAKYLVNTFNDVGCYFIAFKGISNLEADRLSKYIAMMNNYLDMFGLLKNSPASVRQAFPAYDYDDPRAKDSYNSKGAKAGAVFADVLNMAFFGPSYRRRSGQDSRPYSRSRADLDAAKMIQAYNMAHAESGTGFDMDMLRNTPNGSVDRSMVVESGETVSSFSEQKMPKDIDGVQIHEANHAEDIDGLMDELNSLIGLESVKSSLNNLINLVKVRKMREEMGLKVPEMSLHLVFSGNPGTGKTTVARLLSKIYHQLGVVSKGQMIEVDRAGLVEGYVGQTAQKTAKVCDSAMGGILFIDEAYTLANNDGQDFGQEAIDTILKRMEDNRGDFIVIAAGYTEEMNDFISSNPGLKSRFNKFIEFPDYSGEELLDIYRLMCQSQDFVLTGEAEEYVGRFLARLSEKHEENFANAREVRNYFERCIERQAGRIVKEPVVDENTLTTIHLMDVEE